MYGFLKHAKISQLTITLILFQKLTIGAMLSQLTQYKILLQTDYSFSHYLFLAMYQVINVSKVQECKEEIYQQLIHILDDW